MLFVEIQEGRVRMSKKAYFDTLGATASCVMRAVDAGIKFSAFNDSSRFVEKIHGDPRLKDPPSDDECLSSKACASTEKIPPAEESDDESATGLTPLTPPEEVEKVSF